MSPSKPINVNGDGHIQFGGYGTCSSAYEMDVRLVHNYQSTPDLVDSEFPTYNAPNFSGFATTCDGGGTTQYYTELAFYFNGSGDVQRVSATKTLTHC
jgi:hypothetical protein